MTKENKGSLIPMNDEVRTTRKRQPIGQAGDAGSKSKTDNGSETVYAQMDKKHVRLSASAARITLRL